MGGGTMPVGAVLGTERAMGGFDDLSTGSTWSWLPGSVAAALATLDAFERDDVLTNVAELERVARVSLAAIEQRFEEVGDVRAHGCFLAIEFVRDRAGRRRDHDLQDRVAAELLRRGVIADSSTTSLNLQPSLLMPPDRLEAALAIVAEAIAAVR
jgi:4-aminobutyrate aminotransferase-like enzyme